MFFLHWLFLQKTLDYKYILHCSFVQEIEYQDWFIILVNEKATFSYPPKGKKVWHFSPRLAKYALYDCSGTHSVRLCNMYIVFQIVFKANMMHSFNWTSKSAIELLKKWTFLLLWWNFEIIIHKTSVIKKVHFLSSCMSVPKKIWL